MMVIFILPGRMFLSHVLRFLSPDIIILSNSMAMFNWIFHLLPSACVSSDRFRKPFGKISDDFLSILKKKH